MLPTFMTALMIKYERKLVLQSLHYFLSSPMTLHEGQLNWHALKGFAKGYQCASFHDRSYDSVLENADL